MFELSLGLLVLGEVPLKAQDLEPAFVLGLLLIIGQEGPGPVVDGQASHKVVLVDFPSESVLEDLLGLFEGGLLGEPLLHEVLLLLNELEDILLRVVFELPELLVAQLLDRHVS